MTTALVSGLDPASFSSVIKPSHDLFRYVNGPWIDTYRLPDDRSRYGAFDKLAEDAERQIRDILEDEDGCPAAKSQALYHSFLDTDAIEAAGIDPIREDLALIDGAEDKASLVRVLGSLNPRDEIDLFGMGVYGDPADPDTNILHLVQGGIGLPDEAYYREDRYEPIRQAYVDMVSTLLRLAGYAEHHADSDAMAKRFLDVETRIAAHHWDNVAVRDPQKTYNMTSFDQLCGRWI